MRRYSPEEKSRALVLYDELGPCGAARKMGIPKGTVGVWAAQTGRTFNSEKTQAATASREARIAAVRAEVKERLMAQALDLLNRMNEEHAEFRAGGKEGPFEVTLKRAPAQACQQYATSVGILIDKFRLESGEVTSRDEHHNVTESQLDTEIAGLLADLAPAGKASAGAPASGNGNGRKPVGTAHTHGETEGLS